MGTHQPRVSKDLRICVIQENSKEKRLSILRSRAVAHTLRHSPNTIVKFNIVNCHWLSSSHIISSSNKRPAGSSRVFRFIMSETQGSQSSDQSNEEKNDVTPTETESKDEKNEKQIEEKTIIETPEETMLENITDKLTESRHEETVKRLVKSPSSEEPRTQRGECRLLPVLVDLRSSLETNSNSTCTMMSRQNDADLLPITEGTLEPKLDINYFQDLCTSDLKTALTRLEDTLKKVDINALTKYSLSLEPSDKFHLLQLISTLVSNLKRAKSDENADEQIRPSPPPSPLPPASTRRPRKRGNRHTIGVSSEELASARRWLEQERGAAAVKIIPKTIPETPPPLETPPAPPAIDNNKDSRILECPWTVANDINVPPPRTCDKHIKDAINQKQSLQHRIKENDSTNNLSSLTSAPIESSTEHWESLVETPLSPQEDRLSYKFNNYMQPNSDDHTFCNGNSISNKYSAKKSKLKRANTIDIPNYLKMQAEKQKMQAGNGNGLRRPIDISDKVAWNQFCGPQSMNPSPAIPSFQPKTENDKKFLALITRNNDNQRDTWTNIPPSSVPFKSFNYRQTNSVADKNWKSRFSNIKTAFDKPQSDSSSVSSSPATSVFSTGPFASRRNSKDFHGFIKHHEEDVVPKFETRNFPIHFEENGDRVALVSRRFSAASKIENMQENRISQPITPRHPAFTHAATSPFKKFPFSPKNDIGNQKVAIPSPSTGKPVPSCYLPACATGGLLKAKVKMFDHQAQPQVPQVHNQPKPLNPVNRNRQFNNEKVPLFEKSNRNSRIQQFYINHNDDLRDLRANSQKEKNHQKTNDYLNQNYQSVAVQTSAQSTPKPITPETESFPVDNFYKPPVSEAFYAESENPIYVPPALKEMNHLYEKKYDNYKPKITEHLPHVPLLPPIHLSNEQNVENQDITPDKVITRYTAAIATVENTPQSISPEPPQMYHQPAQMNALNKPPSVPIILQDDMYSILQQSSVPLKPGQPIVLQNDIQRHNMLQLSLIKRIQGEEQQVSVPEPPLIEMNNTQDKINIFEEKSHPVPKINVTSPTKPLPPLSFPGNAKSSIAPIDSSDEYLVSCSTRPNRSIVLSKSESWHQLALVGANKPLQHLQVPPLHSQKPPKSSSPLSQRLSKNFETSGSNSNIALKKIEEKIQKYFNNPHGSSSSLDNQQSTSSNLIEKQSTSSRRSFSPKKMPNTLARSHTMPHLFDDTLDIDKAFDSLFEEATKDNRY